MNHIVTIKDKIVHSDRASDLVNNWQSSEEIVVFTNGCFDLVHRGHIEYLSKAADLGNKLIIGLNTDASVSRIKGPERPLVDEYSRAILLAAIQFINLIVFFDEDTPYELIKKLHPDILVKGSDYKAEDIVGYDVVTGRGGKVETIDFIEGFSTTGLIRKIIQNH